MKNTQKTKTTSKPPQVRGEQSISGSLPDPEADDDMLENMHQLGLQLDETLENPQPLDIGRAVEEAERNRRTGNSDEE